MSRGGDRSPLSEFFKCGSSHTLILPLRNFTTKGSLVGLPLDPDVLTLPPALDDSPKYGWGGHG